MTIQITDWGQREYLDGATMQFAIRKDHEIIAFCDDQEHARKIAHALADETEQVIWEPVR